MTASIKPFLAAAAAIITTFVAISLMDIVIVFFYPPFYSSIAFVVSFGVGGILAAVLGYIQGINHAVTQNKFICWSLILFIIVCGCLCFFLLSKIEDGEYEPVFKVFGATLTLGSLLFIVDKPK